MPSKTSSEMIREMQQEIAYLKSTVISLEKELEKANLNDVRQQLAVLEDRVNELKRVKDESEKRQWQFVYIILGAIATLLVTVIVQLVIAWVKK